MHDVRPIRSALAFSLVLLVASLTVAAPASAQQTDDASDEWSWWIFDDTPTQAETPRSDRAPRGRSDDDTSQRDDRPRVVIGERDGRRSERGDRTERSDRGDRADRDNRAERRRDDRAERRRDERRDDRAERRREERPSERDDEYDREERDDGYERDDRRTEPARRGRPGAGRGGQKAAGGGPPFCRSGAGHPKHGMEWCREKGFAPRSTAQGAPQRDRYDRRGDAPRYEDPRYEDPRYEDPRYEDPRYEDPRYEDRRDPRYESRPDLGDIIFGRTGERRQTPRLSAPQLEEVLGRRVVDQFEAIGRQLGSDGRLAGRWVDGGRDGRVLQLQMGRQPIAELVDRDRDGRVDRTFVLDTDRR